MNVKGRLMKQFERIDNLLSFRVNNSGHRTSILLLFKLRCLKVSILLMPDGIISIGILLNKYSIDFHLDQVYVTRVC